MPRIDVRDFENYDESEEYSQFEKIRKNNNNKNKNENEKEKNEDKNSTKTKKNFNKHL